MIHGTTGPRLQKVLGLLKDWLKFHQVFLILFMAFIAFVFGYAGFEESFRALGQSPSWSDLAYLSLQLFVLESGAAVPITGWTLQFARFLAPLITIYSLILLIFHLFRERLQWIFNRFARNHVVIFGNGAIGPVIAKKFSELGQRCISIAYTGITHHEEYGKEQNGLFMGESSTSERILKNALVTRASHLFIIDDDDGVNLEIAANISRLLKKERTVPLNCHIHLNNPDLSRLFREQQFYSVNTDRMRIDFFNMYHLAGSLLLTEYSPFLWNKEETVSPHVLIVGLGRMGQSVCIHTIQKWRNQKRGESRRIVITVIDKVASEKVRRIAVKYPSIRDYADIRPYDIDVESSKFLDGQYLTPPPDSSLVSLVFVCLGDEASGLVIAFELHKLLQKISGEHGSDMHRTPIVVRTISESGFTHIMKEEMDFIAPFSHIYLFPVLQKTGNPEFLLNIYYELIARSIHERYLANLLAPGLEYVSHESMVPWDELPEEYKESNRKQADDIINKLHAVHCTIRPMYTWDEPLFIFHPDEVERLSVLEHVRWMRERTQKGWIYGKERDDAGKVHPSLVPWDQLPESEKDKDRNAVLVIPLLLQMVDLTIERNPDS